MKTALVWLRQDLRLADNPALYHATQNYERVVVLYCRDETIGAASQWWLHHSLAALGTEIQKRGGRLVLRSGNPLNILTQLLHETDAKAVFWNRCYEPHTIARDTHIKQALKATSITVESFNAHLLLEPWEVKNKSGEPFKVFTPFWRQCLSQLPPLPPLPAPEHIHSVDAASDNLADWKLLPTTPDWAAGLRERWTPGEAGAHTRWKEFLADGLPLYKSHRDRPDTPATSRLSPHLHYGEISVRQLWQDLAPPLRGGGHCEAMTGGASRDTENATKFLSEIGWREFSTHLLVHFPTLPTHNFRPEFDRFGWQENPSALSAWQKGTTGYPIVDAGMRELWHTGWMHNRVRMIVASFLIKHLLIDWRVGERWFWDTLVDADLASNAASWQWVAGSGADAAPYFRIFNPILQGKKFDPEGEYVRHWVPELSKLHSHFIHTPWEAPPEHLARAGLALGKDYPHPIIAHETGRQNALAAFAKLKKTPDAVE